MSPLFLGIIYKIQYVSSGNNSPDAVISANPTSGTAPLEVNLSGSGSSDPDGDSLAYSWNFGDGSSSTGVSVAHTYNAAGNYTVTLTVSDGKGGSNSKSTNITVGTAPMATIIMPSFDAKYNAGDTISYSGSGADVQDGALSASRFSWTIVFHHGAHTHPFLGHISNVANGAFQIPTVGEVSADSWYRIHLKVTDSSGLTNEVTRDILPRKVNLTVTSNIVGLSLTLDGQPSNAPINTSVVVGFNRSIGASTTQTAGGKTYEFVSWSDGGAATHNIVVPSTDTTYTANFQEVSTSIPILRGDLNNDRIVNSLDWSIMNSKWFTNDAAADLNTDGIVNSLDFSIMNGNWLKSG